MYLFWLRAALVFSGIASLAVLPGAFQGSDRWRRFLVPLCIAGVGCNFIGLTQMLSRAGHWVPTSIEETTASFALLLALTFLGLYLRYRAISLGLFALPLVFLLLLPAAVGVDPARHAYEPLRNGWILIHIAFVLTAYAALVLSIVSSLLYLIQERRLKTKQIGGVFSHLPPLETIDQISFRMLVIGFPCMTIGLLAGALIAQQTVGAGYFLDPKVLLSIAMWLLYVWMLYVRGHSGLRGRRAAYLTSLVFLAALTVWVANQFSSVHRFAAP